MTPLALDLLIRARVIELKREALAGARRALFPGPLKRSRDTEDMDTPRPRPLLILPSDSRLLRRLMRGLVYRPH